MSQTGTGNENTGVSGSASTGVSASGNVSGSAGAKDNDVRALLFETGALRVSPEDKPFWYTSGTIGPYYINTHFLYGGESKAGELLGLIDEALAQKHELPGLVAEAALNNYRRGGHFKSAVDSMISYIKENIAVEEMDFISGGERRDWFFSYIAANLLNKPHVTVYKDLGSVRGKTKPEGAGDIVEDVGAAGLAGMKCLHISDLVTEASSFERAWHPAIAAAGGCITASLTVVDRMQGGGRVITGLGAEHHALTGVSAGLFNSALEMGYINKKQHRMVLDYINDPKTSMQAFIDKYSDFITSSLAGGGKDAERARLCVENRLYDISFKTRFDGDNTDEPL